MSAACSHVIAPLKARMMTSWIFMARSTAAAANTMGTSLVAHGCTPAYLKSGHFICSRERTDHVLPTPVHLPVDRGGVQAYHAAHSGWRGPLRSPTWKVPPRRQRLERGVTGIGVQAAGVFTPKH